MIAPMNTRPIAARAVARLATLAGRVIVVDGRRTLASTMTRPARVARLATALAAMGLVFMGAIIEPVYLVPALTAVLALGLTAEARQSRSAGNPAAAGRVYLEHPCPRS